MAKKSKPIVGTQELVLDLGELNPKQELFINSDKRFVAYGGARGGGKSHAVRVKAIMGAVNYEGIKILILRRRYKDIETNQIEPILSIVPPEIAEYNGTQRVLRFINGSKITFGNFDSGSALAYQGQEYDWIFIDEATQFTESEFRILGGCLRGVNNISKQMFLTCNPGGVGHAWVKRLFVDRIYKSGSDDPDENENPDDYDFIPATLYDNAHLLNSAGGAGYRQMLAQLPESMRKAHRDGDWDALAGQYFDELRIGLHTCQPFKIPQEWVRYRTFDYGLDMFACLWIAVDFEGRAYVYREFAQSGLIVSDAANVMHDMTLPNERIAYTIAPPDMWSKQKDTGRTMAEIFMLNGIGIVRGNNTRVQGWIALKEMLKLREDGKPGLIIFSDCKRLVSDLQAVQHDERNPSDVATDPHEFTHMPDALRYFAQLRNLPSFKEEAPVIEDDDDPEDYNEVMTGGAVSAAYLAY